MKLFELNEDWVLVISDEAYALSPFKKLIDKDKSEGKETALKELQYIWFSADIRSDYLIIDEKDRHEEIVKDLALPSKWKISKDVQAAIDFYKKRSETIISKLYRSSVGAANAVADILNKSREMLADSDNPIADSVKILQALKNVPAVMDDLDESYQKVIKEKKENEQRSKGSQTFNTFEDGFDI